MTPKINFQFFSNWECVETEARKTCMLSFNSFLKYFDQKIQITNIFTEPPDRWSLSLGGFNELQKCTIQGILILRWWHALKHQYKTTETYWVGWKLNAFTYQVFFVWLVVTET